MPGNLRIHRPAADVRATTMALLAMGKGEIIAPNYARAKISGWCEAAVIVDHMGYGHTRIGPGAKPVREPARTLSTAVRCRKCDGCRKERRMMWTERAAREWRQSTRTWFVTLTMRPEEHYKLQCRVAARVAEAGGDLNALPAKERFKEVLKDYKDVMRLYVNRLRKGVRAMGWDTLSFRYLWVPEPHKSGAIHFHMLLHEVSLDQPITKARIEGLWRHGFTSAKLVKSADAARYVTKYLGKNHLDGRLNVSTGYGERELEPEELLRMPMMPANPQEVPAPVLPQQHLEAELFAELGPIPGAPEPPEVEEGEDLESCPTGLHAGMKCDCHQQLAQEPDPFGLEQTMLTSHGVPKRRWKLRGWHEPDPALDRWKERPRKPAEPEQPETLH